MRVTNVSIEREAPFWNNDPYDPYQRFIPNPPINATATVEFSMDHFWKIKNEFGEDAAFAIFADEFKEDLKKFFKNHLT